MAFLKQIIGPHQDQRFELSVARSVMGRHPDCEIVLDDGAVSRHHAEILAENGVFRINDLGSRNRTYVNDQDIRDQAHALSHGDRITICELTFLFQEDDRPDLTVDADPSSKQSNVMFDEDEGVGSSNIIDKVDASPRSGRIQFVASAEAKLAAFLEISRSLGKALALDQVLPGVLDSLFKIFIQADRGFVGLKNPQGVLVPRWSKARRGDAEETIRVSRTIVNHVMETQEAILSADAANDTRFVMSNSIAEFRIRSMMCAPLVNSDGQSMGVIQVDTLDQSKRFRQDDLDVLASVAAQAGIAIDNAQMHERALQQQVLERDLELANEVQQGFLPDRPPQLAEYDFFDYYKPANHVGGDYYDYIELPDGRVAIIVADVVGHGVAAALMMAKLSAEARFCLASAAQPAAAMARLNSRLSSLPTDRFVTLVLALLDPVSNSVAMVSAGHMSPIHRRADGTLAEPLDEFSGVPLGIMPDSEYEQQSVTLDKGDSLVMYTDGINEAKNQKDQEFGTPRLRDHLRASDALPEALGRAIIADVRTHVGTLPQEDDMCLVCLRRRS